MKKLTIITINYNNAAGLQRTLESVANQLLIDKLLIADSKLEHVIVDGASTDESVDIIREYESSIINHQSSINLKWVSEPDKGIYNAMNKGIRMATGEYLLFLNSGDALVGPDVVKNFLVADVSADVATGIERMPDDRLIPAPKEETLTYAFFYEDTLLHQSTFIRKDAFEHFGPYREDYRIVSDWEWFFRAIVRDGASYQTLDFVVADFDGEGMSNDAKHRALQNKEREQVHQEILPRVRTDYDELRRLQAVDYEYRLLKSGRFGGLVKLFLKLKAKKHAK